MRYFGKSFILLIMLIHSLCISTLIVTAGSIQIRSGLADYQVFQRNKNDQVSISVGGTCQLEGQGVIQLDISDSRTTLAGFEGTKIGNYKHRRWQARISNIPVGGPYTFTLRFVNSPSEVHAEKIIRNILVGDLWILAGQSNMQGIGDLENADTPSIYVNMYGYDESWSPANEPLHWLLDSIDPVHHGNQQGKSLEAARIAAKRNAKVGAGCGLPFAKEMVKETGIPVGLIPCAHGGTSMEQWDPGRRDEKGTSLYSSMYRRFHAVGGKVKGVLWYQGEADAQKKSAPIFHDRFVQLVQAFRRDLKAPELPFYYVQIGRFVTPGSNPFWNVIQEQQRRCATEIPNCEMAASVDLNLDDLIHIDTEGHQRLGKRLARLALINLFGQDQWQTGPAFQAIEPVPDRRLRFRVMLNGVNGRIKSMPRIGGFSIRDGAGSPLHLIFKTKITKDGQAIELFLREKPPLDAFLWYGFGMNPFCNVIDQSDLALPAFGPISMQEINYWPLFEFIQEHPQSPNLPIILSCTGPFLQVHPEKTDELYSILQSVFATLSPAQIESYQPYLFSLGDFSGWDQWFENARIANLEQRRKMAKSFAELRSTKQLQFDFIKKWWIAGPFDNTADQGFDHIYQPEKQSSLASTYSDGIQSDLKWQPAETNASGYLDFTHYIQPSENGVVYAQTVINSQKKTEIPLLFGSNDAAVLWVNGREVHRSHVHRGAQPAQDLIIVKLKAGKNQILFKVDQIGGGWGLYLQMLDKDGVLTIL